MVEVVGSILAAVATWLLGYIGKLISDKKKEAEIVEALKVGIDNTEAEIVELWRDKGKLTKEEQAQARSHALNIAKDELGKPALKLLSTWSSEKIFSLIDRLVQGKKK
jgi:hypothetical protein